MINRNSRFLFNSRSSVFKFAGAQSHDQLQKSANRFRWKTTDGVWRCGPAENAHSVEEAIDSSPLSGVTVGVVDEEFSLVDRQFGRQSAAC